MRERGRDRQGSDVSVSLKTLPLTSCSLIRQLPSTLDSPGVFRNGAEGDTVVFGNITSGLDENLAAHLACSLMSAASVSISLDSARLAEDGTCHVDVLGCLTGAVMLLQL